MNDILKRLEDRDISAWSDAYSCRARGAEAATRIRELEAELAALREARGVMVKPLVWDGYKTTDAIFNYSIHVGYGLLEGCFALTLCGIAVGEYSSEDAAKAAAQSDYERRILAALEPAPVTVGEAARVFLEEWIHGEGPLGDLVCYSMDEDGVMRPDIDGQWTEFPRIEAALRALADAGEAGDV